MHSVPIESRSRLSPEAFASLEATVGEHRSMKHAFDWALTKTPLLLPEDMVTQDEFSHDFLFRLANDLYLVYDST